jgi:hypothetical protein
MTEVTETAGMRTFAATFALLLVVACGGEGDAGPGSGAGGGSSSSGQGGDGGCAADLRSDPANCGACGHDCLGGACVGGACGPTEIGSTGNYATRLAVGGGALAWKDLNGVVNMKESVPSPSLSLMGNAVAIALIGGVGYATVRETSLAGAHRFTPGQSGSDLLASLNDAAGGSDGEAFYVLANEFGGGGSGLFRVEGGAVVPIASGNIFGNWNYAPLAVTTTSVVWAGDAIRRIAKDGSGGVELVVAESAWVVAADEVNAYFIGDAQELRVAPLAGGAATALLESGALSYELALDESHVYVIEVTPPDSEPNTSRLLSVPKDGGAPVVVFEAASPRRITTVASTREALYYGVHDDDAAGSTTFYRQALEPDAHRR